MTGPFFFYDQASLKEYKITKAELSDQIGQVVINMKGFMAPCIILAMIIIIISFLILKVYCAIK